jgi:hypothetical protein
MRTAPFVDDLLATRAHQPANAMNKSILSMLFTLIFVTGCASPYVKSTASDAAQVTIYMNNPGLVKAYVHLYEDGERCLDARPLRANSQGGVTNVEPVSITVTPNKLLSLGIHGVREDRRVSCDLLVSFMPEAQKQYQLHMKKSASGSACGQLQAIQSEHNGRAKPVTVTARKFSHSIGGSTNGCIPL